LKFREKIGFPKICEYWKVKEKDQAAVLEVVNKQVTNELNKSVTNFAIFEIFTDPFLLQN
jgi:hypothetical protein